MSFSNSPRLATAIPKSKKIRAKQKSMGRGRGEGGHRTAGEEECCRTRQHSGTDAGL